MEGNLLGIPETLLPADPAAALLEEGQDPQSVAARFPSSSLVWSVLSEQALDDGRTIEAYAFARTGYHRALDSLRKSGWRGQGPGPGAARPHRRFPAPP